MIVRQIKTYDKAPHIKQETFATHDPGVSNDGASQYEVGSKWTNTLTGTTYTCVSNALGAAVWNAVDAGGLNRKYLEEAVVLTAAATAALVTQLPANSTPLSAELNLDAAVVFSGGGLNVGFGTAGDPDGYVLSTGTLTKNAKSQGKGALCGVYVPAAVSLILTACNGAGAATGAFVSGTVRCRLYYETMTNLPNA